MGDAGESDVNQHPERDTEALTDEMVDDLAEKSKEWTRKRLANDNAEDEANRAEEKAKIAKADHEMAEEAKKAASIAERVAAMKASAADSEKSGANAKVEESKIELTNAKEAYKAANAVAKDERERTQPDPNSASANSHQYCNDMERLAKAKEEKKKKAFECPFCGKQ